MTIEQRISPERLNEIEHLARRDDWHYTLVGSDVRLLVGDLRRARAALTSPAMSPTNERGYVVASANGDKFRVWRDGMPDWTTDPHEATRYYARSDAEAVHRDDEDAWRVLPFTAALESASTATGEIDQRIAAMDDALRSIRAHCEIQPSALAKAIVATCDNALNSAPAPHSAEREAAIASAAQFLSDRLDDLEWHDGQLDDTLRDYMGHVDPAHARLKAALRSRSRATQPERDEK